MLTLQKNIWKPLVLRSVPQHNYCHLSITPCHVLFFRSYSSSDILFKRSSRESFVSKRNRNEESSKLTISNDLINNNSSLIKSQQKPDILVPVSPVFTSKGKIVYTDEDFSHMERITYHLADNRSIKRRIKYLNQFLQFITAQQATPVEFRSPVNIEQLFAVVLPALEILLRDMSSSFHSYLNHRSTLQPSEIAHHSKTPTFSLLLTQVARFSQNFSQFTQNIISLNHMNCASATVNLHHAFLSHIVSLIQHHQTLPFHPQYQEEQIVLTDALCDSFKAVQTISDSFSELSPVQFSLLSLIHKALETNKRIESNHTGFSNCVNERASIHGEDANINAVQLFSEELVAKTIHSLFAPIVSRLEQDQNPPDLLWVIKKAASRLEIMRQLLPPVSSVSQMLLLNPLDYPFLPRMLHYIAAQSISDGNVDNSSIVHSNVVAAEETVEAWDTLTYNLSQMYPDILLRHSNRENVVVEDTRVNIVQDTIRLLSFQAVSQACLACVSLPPGRSSTEEVLTSVSRVWSSVATLGLRFGVTRGSLESSPTTSNINDKPNLTGDINAHSLQQAEQEAFRLIQECLRTLIPFIRPPETFPSLSSAVQKKDLEAIGQKYCEKEIFYLQHLLQPLVSLSLKASDFNYTLQQTLLRDVCDSLRRLSIDDDHNKDTKYIYNPRRYSYGTHRDTPVSYGQLLQCEEKWELFCAILETTHAFDILPAVSRHGRETDKFLESVSQALRSVSQSLSLVTTSTHSGTTKKGHDLLQSLRFLDQIDYDDNDIYSEDNFTYDNEQSDVKSKRQNRKTKDNVTSSGANSVLNEDNNTKNDVMQFFTRRLLQSLCLFNYKSRSVNTFFNDYDEPLMQWKLLMSRQTQRLLSERIVAEHHPSVTNFAELAHVFELLSELKVPFYDSETAMRLISPLMEEVKRLGRTDNATATLQTLTQLYLGFGKLGVQWKSMEPELKQLLGHVLTQEGKHLSLQHLSDDTYFDDNIDDTHSDYEQHLVDAPPRSSVRLNPPLLVEVLAFSLMTKWRDLTRLEQSLVLRSLAVQLRRLSSHNIDDTNNTGSVTQCLDAMKALGLMQCPWHVLAHSGAVKEVVCDEETEDTGRHSSARACHQTLLHLLLRHLTLRDLSATYRDSPLFTPETQQRLSEQRSDYVAKLLVRMQAKWHDIDTTLQHYLASPWIHNRTRQHRDTVKERDTESRLRRLSSVANSLTLLAFDASPLPKPPKPTYSPKTSHSKIPNQKTSQISQTQYDTVNVRNDDDDTLQSSNSRDKYHSDNIDNDNIFVDHLNNFNITNTMDESFDDQVFFTELEDELLHDWCRHLLDDLLLLLCPATPLSQPQKEYKSETAFLPLLLFCLYLQHEQPGLWSHYVQTQKPQMTQLLSVINENTKRFPQKNFYNNSSDTRNYDTPSSTASNTSSRTHLRFQEALQKELSFRSRHRNQQVSLVSEYPGFASRQVSGVSQDAPLSVDTDILPMDLALLDSVSRQPVAFIEIDGPHHYLYLNQAGDDDSNFRKKGELRKIDQMKDRLYGRKYPNVPIYRVSHRDLNFVMLNAEANNPDLSTLSDYDHSTRTKDFNKKDNFSEHSRSERGFLNEQKSKTSNAAKNIIEQMQKDGIL